MVSWSKRALEGAVAAMRWPMGSMARIQKGEAVPRTRNRMRRGHMARCSRGGEIGHGVGGAEAEVAVEDALDGGEHVGGGEDDAKRGNGDDSPEDAADTEDGLHGAGKDEEFTDKAVEHGQADKGQGSRQRRSVTIQLEYAEARPPKIADHDVGTETVVQDIRRRTKRAAPDDAFR